MLENLFKTILINVKSEPTMGFQLLAQYPCQPFSTDHPGKNANDIEFVSLLKYLFAQNVWDNFVFY